MLEGVVAALMIELLLVRDGVNARRSVWGRRTFAQASNAFARIDFIFATILSVVVRRQARACIIMLIGVFFFPPSAKGWRGG